MSNIGSMSNTFSRTRENTAKFGYCPTSLEIVRMEMELISFAGVSPGKKVSICDLTGGEGDQLAEMHAYIQRQGLEPIAYYNEITNKRYEVAKEKYGELPNFHFCNTDLFRLRCRNKTGRKYDTRTMVIIRNNPPYGYTDHLGESVRLEDRFFLENDRYMVEGGIHIFEIPITTLINYPGLMRKITYRYENVNIYKFPKGEFEKFKQVVVVGVRKKQNSNDIDTADEWVERLRLGKILPLDNIVEPVYCLTDSVVARAKEVTVFRDGEVNDITLTRGLLSELDSLFKREREADLLNNKVEVLKDEIAIIERTIGHRALELASGKYNKICGDVLVYGYTDKNIVTSTDVEGDKEVTTETEIIVSGIEVTNKYGDVIRKES